MSQSQTAANDEQPSSRRPERTFKQGGVEVSVWKNRGETGDMYNTTIRNTYKDEEGNWKDTSNFGPADLAVLAQLSGQAFQAIVELKSQGRGR